MCFLARALMCVQQAETRERAVERTGVVGADGVLQWREATGMEQLQRRLQGMIPTLLCIAGPVRNVCVRACGLASLTHQPTPADLAALREAAAAAVANDSAAEQSTSVEPAPTFDDVYSEEVSDCLT